MVKGASEATDAALAGLQEVASSEAIELVEVTIARDLVAQSQARVRPQLPQNVDVP